MRDLLLKPPADNPYDTLKAELIKRTAASEQRKLQQLISGEELGDRKPTQLLRKMQQLLGDKMGALTYSFFLRELFLLRLPANVRMVLASADVSMDLGKLADMADKVMEVAVPTVAAIPSSTATNSQDVQQLRQEVARLAELVTSLTTSLRRRRPSGHGRTPSPTRTNNPPKLCWYHAKFGGNAKKCKKPCAWEETTLQLWIQVILPLVTFSTSLKKKRIYDFWWTLDQKSVSFPPPLQIKNMYPTRSV